MKRNAIAACLSLFAFVSTAGAQVGDVTFETSASPEAQAHFLKGVAILHSFGFEDAIETFRKAQELEPDFALAYWGEAMANNGNPLTTPTQQDLAEARRALQKLAPTRAERVAKAKTDWERMWMEAVETLYGPGEKEDRDWAYAAQMERVVEAHPDNEEARAFYALALLGTVRRAGNDFRQQMHAAAVAQELFRENPKHPGAAHYIIHAFDDPLHAPLALYAADRYAEIAPDVEHALHMPSHIYVQLGLWDKVVMSNERAYRASVEWAKAKGLSDSKRDFHALSWMQYGHLERGELAKAREAIEEIRAIAEREDSIDRIKATLSNMRARYVLESGEWNAIEIPIATLVKERYAGDVYLLLAAGVSAAKRGDVATAETVERRLAELEGQDTQFLKSALQGQVTLEDLKVSTSVARLEVASLVRLAKGEKNEAVRLMEEAMAKEKEMHPAYGPPEPMVPPLELYASVLFEAGRTEEAFAAYEEMLRRLPNRSQSLLGAARAAEKLGKHDVALARYETLAAIAADGERTPRLEEAKRFLGETSP
jgi:tetratricopeptide (TPR) repeat protein